MTRQCKCGHRFVGARLSQEVTCSNCGTVNPPVPVLPATLIKGRWLCNHVFTSKSWTRMRRGKVLLAEFETEYAMDFCIRCGKERKCRIETRYYDLTTGEEVASENYWGDYW